METEHHSRNNAPAYSDEIDLFQLCADLWRKRVLIMLCTVAVLACGVGYAYLAPEVYKAEASLLPPPASSLAELTAANQYRVTPSLSPLEAVFEVSPKDAFDLTNRYLGSAEVKRKLINSPVFVKSVDGASPKAAELKMSVSLPNVKKQRNHTVVSIELHYAGQAAELVNEWIEIAMQGARDELVENTRVALQEKIKTIDQQIEVKKKHGLSQLDAELLQLREAKIIADKSGFLEPVDIATENLVTGNRSHTNVMRLRSLYLVGSRVLSAEIEALESRREKGEGYTGLDQLELQLVALQQITLNPDLVKTAKVDLRAVPPEGSIKSKRTLIMLVSLVLGAMVGIFVALISQGMEKRRVC